MDLLIEYIKEIVSILQEYQRKEDVMQMLQADIASRIKAGEISDDEGVREYVATVQMAANALKDVPLMAFKVR